jgi:mono/diheme cytochrome c family protein
MLNNFLLFSAAILFWVAPSFGPTFAEGRPLQDAPASTNPVKPTAASLERAKKLYQVDCAMCHGDNGNGKTDLGKDMQLSLPDWTNPATLANKLDQSLFNAIRNGKGSMPSEVEGRANDTDVWNLIHYIRGMSKGHAAAPVNPDGQPVAPVKPDSQPVEPVKPNS